MNSNKSSLKEAITSLQKFQNSIQLIDYPSMFNKKVQVTHDINIHAEIQCKIENLQQSTKKLHQILDGNIQIFGGFEGANILFAHKEKEDEINILLNSDTNTNGCTQWFYFIIQSDSNIECTIRILNNRRKHSLCSRANHIQCREQGDDWKPSTFNCFYYKTNINHPYYHSSNTNTALVQSQMDLYTLQFNVKLRQGVKTEIALTKPYLFSDMEKLLKQTPCNSLCRIKKFSRSPLQLPIYRVTFKPSFQRVTESIVMIARQHPSETSGSFVCEAILKELFKNYNLPYKLIIFPMLNPDGVYLGNSRCNLNGVDLNRKWEFNDFHLAPEVGAVKEYLYKQNQKYPIQFAIDFHGHSQQFNSFIYGCLREGSQNIHEYVNAKLFSRMLYKECKHFSVYQSKFRVLKEKNSTARITLSKQFGVKNCFTIEISYYGYSNLHEQHIQRYTEQNFKELAQAVLVCLSKYKQELINQFQVIDSYNALESQQKYKRSRSLSVNNQQYQSFYDSGEYFSQSEVESLLQNLKRGIDPSIVEQFAESDSEAECDIQPRKNRKQSIQSKLFTKRQQDQEKIEPNTLNLKLRKQKTMDDYEEPLLASRVEKRMLHIRKPINRCISRHREKSEDISVLYLQYLPFFQDVTTDDRNINNSLFPYHQSKSFHVTEAFIRQIKQKQKRNSLKNRQIDMATISLAHTKPMINSLSLANTFQISSTEPIRIKQDERQKLPDVQVNKSFSQMRSKSYYEKQKVYKGQHFTVQESGEEEINFLKKEITKKLSSNLSLQKVLENSKFKL